MYTSSKSVSSQMQHLQHNFKVKYWFKIKLYVQTFEFQNGSTRKLTYKQSLSLNAQPWVLKSPQSQSLDVVVEFNFEWITLVVKQILGNTKKTCLGYNRRKYTNIHFASHICIDSGSEMNISETWSISLPSTCSKVSSTKKKQIVNIFEQKLIWQEVCWKNSLPLTVLY